MARTKSTPRKNNNFAVRGRPAVSSRGRTIQRSAARRGGVAARNSISRPMRRPNPMGRGSKKSFLTGIRVQVNKTSRKVAIATEGYYVNGHHLTIGKPKPINKMVKFANPINALMYSGSTKTQSTNSGMQQVQYLEINKTAQIKDIFKNFSNMNYDNNGDNATAQSGAGNANNENMNTIGTSNPEAQRILGLLNKVYLEKCKLLIRVVNDCELGCKMEILPMIARRDILTWNQGAQNGFNAATQNPYVLWKQLILQQQGYSAAGATSQIPFIDVSNPGLRPYDRRFKKDMERFYKMLTPAKFMLQPGQNTQYHFAHNIYQEISGMDIQDYQGTEGITLYFMFFVEGSLVGSTKVADDLKTSIGTSSIRILYEQTNYVRACSFARGHTFQYGRPDRGFTVAEQTFMDAIDGEPDVNPQVADVL